MARLSPTFHALLKEAQFTGEMLGAGATQIGKAHYASKGTYFQAFTSLSTGIERIGKLCLMLDFYIDNKGQFPDKHYLKNIIGHRLDVLYAKSQEVVKTRNIQFEHLSALTDSVHIAILEVLSDFATGDRYSNIDFLSGAKGTKDPISGWYRRVDMPLLKNRVSERKKDQIVSNAQAVGEILEGIATVLHISETGDEITDIGDASLRRGINEAVSPYRRLYVLQIIRYWVELLVALEWLAQKQGQQDIPFFGEALAIFRNSDSYFRSRKTWLD